MIPIIDIAPLVGGNAAELDDVVNSIANACETYGFFAIINHGVDAEIINEAWNASQEFFDMESSVKQSVKMASDYP